jgi:hypothetical protein
MEGKILGSAEFVNQIIDSNANLHEIRSFIRIQGLARSITERRSHLSHVFGDIAHF